MDTTEFTRASISDVVHTFFEAVVLVVIVVFVFLQSLRATLIPVLAVPVSIVGTFMGMLALGFSINMLTLFGMVLAIGIVVDDAIVVIENVERNMTVHKLNPKDAAKRAMDEVAGPVVAIVLVLCAVFVPVAFLSGITGQLYKQFAITIAISVVISGLVALTLSPALAALLLKPGHHEKKGFFKWFDNAFERMTHGYTRLVKLAIKRFIVALLLFAGMIALSFVMFKSVPSAFLPPEDQGYLLGAVIMPDAASLDRTGDVSQHVTDYFMKQPAVGSVTVVDGFSLLDSQNKNNAGTFFIGFKSFDERYSSANIRTQNARAVLLDAYKHLSQVKEGIILPVNPPSIPGLGTTGGTEMWIQSKGDATIPQLAGVVNEFLAKAKQRPELAQVTSTFNASSQQLLVNVDRDKAETLGVPIEEVYSAMQTMFGSLYVSQFNRSSRLWQVILQAEPSYRMNPEDLEQIFVRGKTGDMIPLKSVVTTKFVTGPDLVTRFNNFPAVKITANAAPGYSSGQVLDTLEEVADQVMPTEPAIRRADGGAVRPLRRAGCRPVTGARKRRVLPDRADDAGRARGEERDPDLRVRRAQSRIGRIGVRRRRDRGDRAAAPDRDDFARVHSRLRAARDRDRGVGEQPPFDRHGRDRRDARRDGHRGLLHSDVLLRARNHVREIGRRQEDARGGPGFERRPAGRQAIGSGSDSGSRCGRRHIDRRALGQTRGGMTCCARPYRALPCSRLPAACSVRTTSAPPSMRHLRSASPVRMQRTSSIRCGGNSSRTRA
jgi:multidrug efflux pump subunit AcrB